MSSINRNAEAVGIKISYNHIEKFPEISSWIVSKNAKIIHLIRKNILKTILSLQTAKESKLYHFRLIMQYNGPNFTVCLTLKNLITIIFGINFNYLIL